MYEHNQHATETTLNGQIRYSLSLVLWMLFSCFAASAALLFQQYLLPLIPLLHADLGLLDGDSIYFHSVVLDALHDSDHLPALFQFSGVVVSVLALLVLLYGRWTVLVRWRQAIQNA